MIRPRHSLSSRPASCALACGIAFIAAAAMAAGPYVGVRDRQLNPCSRHTPLSVTEIMYKPADPGDGHNYEFIEVLNTDPVACDISGFRITGAADYTFPSNTVLGARAMVLVAREPEALAARYGITNAVGPLSTNLPASGVVRVRNQASALLLEIEYSDETPWPLQADGAGHSLVLRRPDYGENDVRAWDASAVKGGSPGAIDPDPASPWSGVVINEFLAHTDLPDVDAIELYNRGTQAVDISGCSLSDDPDVRRFIVPTNTFLPPGGVIAWGQPDLGFNLSMHGDDIWFENPDGTRMLDAVRFGPQANGISTGRHPDGAPTFHELTATTLGQCNTNTTLLIRDVVINELMFHPISGYDEDEYVELYNRSGSPVDVGYWTLEGGVTFFIPPGTTIPAHGYLVIAKDVTNLLARYSQLNTTNTLGNYSGRLSDRGDRVALRKPDDMALPYVDRVMVDEVTYTDGWAPWTDGGGSSLELTDPHSDNRLAMNWAASDETQKSTNVWTTVDWTDSIDNGLGATTPFQVFAILPGEYIVDNIDLSAGSTNYFADNFESGGAGWTFKGSHYRSSVETGVGYGGSAGLHVRASERGEFSGSDARYENHIQKEMFVAPAAGQVVRLQAKVRWLRGFPGVLMGCRGYWFAAPGELRVPQNLGSPGLANGGVTNAGPALQDVAQSPVLPAAGANVLVTCRASDPDGVASISLKYRIDPSSVTNTVPMRDDGSAGDLLAGDGIYSAILPGQTSGKIAAFVIEATDAAWPASSRSRYPLYGAPGTPPTECLVAWGLSRLSGTGIPAYRAIMTSANSSLLGTLGGLSKELVDATFLYDDVRAIYNVGTRYRGGVSMSGYTIRLPKSDRLMGGAKLSILSGGDPNRIIYLPWLCRRLGIAEGVMRPIGFALGTGALSLLDDWLTPSTELCNAWFGDPDPEVFKNQDWNGDAFAGPTGAFTNQFGALKQSIYAGRQVKRATLHPNDDYTQVFKLATALATTNAAQYVSRVQSVIDVRSWAAYVAFCGLFGDTDHYGYNYTHNYYVYIPRAGYSQLFLHDMDWSFNGSPAVRWPSAGLSYAPTKMFVNTPTFTRSYWAILKEGADGPMTPAVSDPFYDAWNAAYANDGFAPSAASGFKTYIAGARTAVYSGLAPITVPVSITTSGGANFSTSTNPVMLQGTAPVDMETITVNGSVYPVVYTSLTNWQLRVWLEPGPNSLTVSGFNHAGNLVASGTDSITVTYTGPTVLPDGKLVINEIMYNAAVPYASFIELYNTSTNTLALSGLRLDGVDCTIGAGRTIGPGGYAVVASSIPGYQCAYSNAEVVVAEYSGTLDNGGETLRLQRPDGTNWVTIDEVRYDDDAPWPVEADGEGFSLQLIDPSQSHNRAGNWGTSKYLDCSWVCVDRTGTATNIVQAASQAKFQAWLQSPGSLLLDRMSLVAGTVPETGSSRIGNGDLETGALSPWTSIGNHAAALAATNASSGTYSLRISSPAAGGTSSNVYQGPLGLTAGAQYTLRYWYLQTYAATGLTIRVTGTDIGSSPPLRPPEIARCTPGLPNNIVRAQPPYPLLWINEVMPSNRTFTVDNAGDPDPWIELYNADTTSVDLTEFALTDDFSNLARWVFPPGLQVPAGERLLIWADGETNETVESALHCGFRLAPMTGEVALVHLYSNRMIVVDSLVYSQPGADESYGSYPDGDPTLRQVFTAPTPGAPNNPTSQPVCIRINEWMPHNTLIGDPADGKHPDWFELYNAGDQPVHLGGYWLDDALSGTNRHRIPGGKFIAPHGFVIVWTDNDLSQNATTADIHMDFSLDNDGEAIGLFAPDGTLVDGVTYGPMAADQSEGLWPDGTDPALPMRPPTPGAPNQVLQVRDILWAEDQPATVGWGSTPGTVYRIDYADSMLDTNWIPLGLVTAESAAASIVDTNAASLTNRFYRISEVP